MTTELTLKISADTKGLKEIKDVLRDLKGTVGTSSAVSRGFKDLKRDSGILKTGMLGLSESIDKLKKSEKGASSETQKLTSKMASLKKENNSLSLSVKKLEGDLTKLNKTKKSSAASSKNLADGFRGAAGAAGKLWLAYGALLPMMAGYLASAAAIKAVSVSTGLEYTLANIQALNLSDESGMKQLKKDLLEIEGMKGPNELARGLKVYAKAGIEAAESIEAVKDTALLATMGELDLNSAVKFTTRTLRTFGLETDQLSHVTGVLAYTASSSQMEVADLGAAMAYSTELASGLGFSLEEVSAAMAVLHDKGIAASRAGTSLRTSFIRMAEPTGRTEDALYRLGVSTVDTEGKQKSLIKIVGDLSKSMSGLSKTSKIGYLKDIAGLRAYKALQELLVAFEQGRLDEKLADINREADTYLSKFEKIVGESSIGQWNELTASAERTLIGFTDLLDTDTHLTNWLKETNKFMSELERTLKLLKGFEFPSVPDFPEFPDMPGWMSDFLDTETSRPSPALDAIGYLLKKRKELFGEFALTPLGAMSNLKNVVSSTTTAIEAANDKISSIKQIDLPTTDPFTSLQPSQLDLYDDSLGEIFYESGQKASLDFEEGFILQTKQWGKIKDTIDDQFKIVLQKPVKKDLGKGAPDQIGISEELAKIRNASRLAIQEENGMFTLLQSKYEAGYVTRADLAEADASHKSTLIELRISSLEEEFALNQRLSSQESVLGSTTKKKYKEKNVVLNATLRALEEQYYRQEELNSLDGEVFQHQRTKESLARTFQNTQIISANQEAQLAESYAKYQAEYATGYHSKLQMMETEQQYKILSLGLDARKISSQIAYNKALMEGSTEAEIEKLSDTNNELQNQLALKYKLISAQQLLNAAVETSGSAGAMQSLRTYAQGAADDFQLFGDVAANALKGAEDAMVDLVVNGKADFSDLARSILADLARIYAKKLLVGALGGDTAGSSGSDGGLVGLAIGGIQSYFGGGITAGVSHQGGRVGSPSATRQVNPAIFSNAPRFHNGLKSDEFPTILQRGEEVTSKADVQKERITQTENTPAVSIINVIDPAMVESYMSSSAGKKIVMNHIANNSGEVKGVL